MSFDGSSKRQRVERTDVSETVLDESTYVYQLLRVFGYEDVTKRVVDTLCAGLDSRYYTAVDHQWKGVLSFQRIAFTQCFYVVLTPTLPFLLDPLLSLLSGKESILEGRYNSGTRK